MGSRVLPRPHRCVPDRDACEAAIPWVSMPAPIPHRPNAVAAALTLCAGLGAWVVAGLLMGLLGMHSLASEPAGTTRSQASSPHASAPAQPDGHHGYAISKTLTSQDSARQAGARADGHGCPAGGRSSRWLRTCDLTPVSAGFALALPPPTRQRVSDAVRLEAAARHEVGPHQRTPSLHMLCISRT